MMSDASGEAVEPSSTADDEEYRDLARNVIQCNKNHQANLTDYIKRLTTEWNNIDVLINTAEAVEYDSESDNEMSEVVVPDAQRAIGPFALRGLLRNDTSPFHQDALRLDTYNRLTTVQLMKKKEVDVLSEAVRTENYRLNAFEEQRRIKHKQPPPSPVDLDRNIKGLDWERICQKVADSCQLIPRTPRDYEIRWVGDLHPDVKHQDWSAEESATLVKLVEEYDSSSTPDWVQIANKLGTNRRPIDIMSKATVKAAHRWDEERDRRLMEAVRMYGEDNWMLVARYVSDETSAQQASQRYNRNIKEEFKRRAWTPDDDQRLTDVVEIFGTFDWQAVANFMCNRTNDQCRERWESFERSRNKDQKWSLEEDIQLWNSVDELGHKWKEIAKRLENKTADKCRTRHATLRENNFDPSSGAIVQPKSRTKRGRRNFANPGEECFPLPADIEPPEAVAGVESTVSEMYVDLDASTLSPPPQSRKRNPAGRRVAPTASVQIETNTATDQSLEAGRSEVRERAKRPKPKKRGKAAGTALDPGAAEPSAVIASTSEGRSQSGTSGLPASPSPSGVSGGLGVALDNTPMSQLLEAGGGEQGLCAQLEPRQRRKAAAKTPLGSDAVGPSTAVASISRAPSQLGASGLAANLSPSDATMSLEAALEETYQTTRPKNPSTATRKSARLRQKQ